MKNKLIPTTSLCLMMALSGHASVRDKFNHKKDKVKAYYAKKLGKPLQNKAENLKEDIHEYLQSELKKRGKRLVKKLEDAVHELRDDDRLRHKVYDKIEELANRSNFDRGVQLQIKLKLEKRLHKLDDISDETRRFLDSFESLKNHSDSLNESLLPFYVKEFIDIIPPHIEHPIVSEIIEYAMNEFFALDKSTRHIAVGDLMSKNARALDLFMLYTMEPEIREGKRILLLIHFFNALKAEAFTPKDCTRIMSRHSEIMRRAQAVEYFLPLFDELVHVQESEHKKQIVLALEEWSWAPIDYTVVDIDGHEKGRIIEAIPSIHPVIASRLFNYITSLKSSDMSGKEWEVVVATPADLDPNIPANYFDLLFQLLQEAR